MKNKILFGILAILGAFAIYFWKENETLAALFVTLVWGVYERVTKEEIKRDFFRTNGESVEQWRKHRK